MVNLRTTPDERKRLAELCQRWPEMLAAGEYDDMRALAFNRMPEVMSVLADLDALEAECGRLEERLEGAGAMAEDGWSYEAKRADDLQRENVQLKAECERLAGENRELRDVIQGGKEAGYASAFHGSMRLAANLLAERDALARRLAEWGTRRVVTTNESEQGE